MWNIILIVFALAWAVSAHAADKEKIIHNFNGGNGGLYASGLVGGGGTLYGTANGGKYGYGLVYELALQSDGSWKETVLHNFGSSDNDGAYPSGIVLSGGYIFGMTYSGGASGYGTIFRLTPHDGKWAEEVLWSFSGGLDGAHPSYAPIFDKSGNLYASTQDGGQYGYGTVVELTPQHGGYTFDLIATFGSSGLTGQNPFGNLAIDGAGNLYGTTPNGGAYDMGTAYELRYIDGGWNGITIYNFGAYENDGVNPEAGFVLDGAGNLYGTTYAGGPADDGTVYELSQQEAGWGETILYKFPGEPGGCGPFANLIFDGSGNLYGTTYWCGTGGVGLAFELSPPETKGDWKLKVLHEFNAVSGRSDGENPAWPLLLDGGSGSLYGTTWDGGSSGDVCVNYSVEYSCGVVYELTP